MKTTTSLPAVLLSLVLFSCGARDTPENRPAAEPTLTRIADLGALDQFAGLRTLDHSPSWSPDGRQIVFCSGTELGMDENLWIQSVDDGELRQLTNTPLADVYPSWSPDGMEIAFTSTRGGSPNVWTIPATGGEPRQLTAAADSVISAGQSIVNWSPDGEQIAFAARQDNNTDLWIISARGGTPRRLTTDPAADQYPAWSPDGTEIAFASDRSGHGDIWIVPATGGTPRPFTTDPLDERTPSWSPDGAWIAFVVERDRAEILIKPVAGGQAVPIPRAPGEMAVMPRWSPDGRKIVFNGGPWNADAWTIPAARGEPSRLTEGLVIDQSGGAVWSPDGRQIAFYASGQEGRDLWKMPVGGGTPIPLTEGGMAESPRGGLCWSPDGRQIAFAAQRGDMTHLWTVPANGGQPRPLTTVPSSWMDWSPDGRRIALTVETGPNEVGIYTMPSAGGFAEPLVDWPATIEWGPDWSPDGKRIAFSSTRASSRGNSTWNTQNWNIWIVPAEGGEAVFLAEGIGPDWSPDGREIVFSAANDIWKIPAAGGTPERLLYTTDVEQWPRWSPDGTRILLIRYTHYSDIWIADVGGLLDSH